MATQAKKSAAPKAPKKAAPKKAVETAGAENAVRVDRRKELTGLVVSDKMVKTIVVQVDRRVRHGLYRKYMVRTRRFKAHDELRQAHVGDMVKLVECRPMSKDKRWTLHSIVRKSAGTALQTAEGV